MELYLVQHGPAKPEAEDPQRPLTEEGRLAVERLATFLSQLRTRIRRIEHSGKLRAQQTAEILAAALDPPEGVRATEGLAPNDDPSPLKVRLDAETENLMIVGHQPHLSRLVSVLLGLAPERPAVQFQMAGVVRLDRGSAGEWIIRWVLPPDLLAQSGVPAA